MRSVFSSKYEINLKYDIKGSSVDRAATNKEKEKEHPTFKDNDLVNDARSINIGAESKQAFMAKLTRDVEVTSNFLLFSFQKLKNFSFFFFDYYLL